MSRVTVCKPHQCAGCKACFDICPKDAITIDDEVEWLDAVIDERECVGCNLCHRVCQAIHPALTTKTINSYQGWALSDARRRGSSGGYATAIMESFIRDGGAVASCELLNGDFRFVLARDEDGLKGFSGSKYVKSNPEGIYEVVARELKAGKEVLFIGLPCQVSAMKNYVALKHVPDVGLFTIDLICHGTPSVRLLEEALHEYGYKLSDISELLFRSSERFGLQADAEALEAGGAVDSYLTAFLHGSCYTESCYSCHYAQRARVGDITLGDSWGTELKDEEAGGISLALVQSDKGIRLISDADIELLPVDYKNAVAHNRQLQAPVKKGPEHDAFFSKLATGKSFKATVFSIYPKYRLKQRVKALLAKVGLRQSGGGGTVS